MTDEIRVPSGAPALLCLYADPRWEEEQTLVYLCNAGPEPLTDVVDASDCISMFTFYCAEPDQRWVEPVMASACRWEAIPPGRGVLVHTLSHKLWDLVMRHRLTLKDSAGRPWRAEVIDLPLNASRLSQDPEAVWVPIEPEPA